MGKYHPLDAAAPAAEKGGVIMIATTIEQSKHLLELGLDPKTADMYYLPQVMNEGETLWPIDKGYDLDDADQPAWSLSALLEVIPKECEPDIQKSPISGVYFAHCFANGKPYITDDHGNAVCAAYEIVCWLLEQGLIKKGGQDD